MREELSTTLLARSHSVIHVGGHTGQEAETYGRMQKSVLWIEAVPQYHDALTKSIEKWPLQKSICALVAEHDGEIRTFHLTSAGGQSSSMYPLSGIGASVWNIENVGKLSLVSTTLDSVLESAQPPHSFADALVIDVQGAEEEVLRGCKDCMHQFRVIVCEVSTQQFYEGQSTYPTIAALLSEYGFISVTRPHKSHATVIWAKPAFLLRCIIYSPMLLARLLKWRYLAWKYSCALMVNGSN